MIQYVMILHSLRFLDGEIINVGKNDHYDGGEASYAPLTVRNASSSDMGKYTCILENSVGESTVQDFIDVSVLCMCFTALSHTVRSLILYSHSSLSVSLFL